MASGFIDRAGEAAGSAEFLEWLASDLAASENPASLIERFGHGLADMGTGVTRISAWLPTSHPELWGTQIVWVAGSAAEVVPRSHDILQTDTYLNTPGEAVYAQGAPLRWRLDGDAQTLPYPMLRKFAEEGYTDYYIRPFLLHNEQAWIALVSSKPGGLTGFELEKIEELCRKLGWKIRVAVSHESLASLLRVYLGQNAAQRVLGGQFRRGTGSTIDAAIWFCDLRGFSQLSDASPPTEMVKILDEYFEAVAGPIEDAGGEILKFIGDAVMAVFPFDEDKASVCRRALSAAEKAFVALAARPGPKLQIGIGLHCGEVYYGNIGGRSRLDFTVIGAAVNEACRIESLCKDLVCPLLMSAQFAQHLKGIALTSFGQQQLKGVAQPREVLTLTSLAAERSHAAP
ncbi:MAG: adenylate/guanylate cyclase domain-containing protein [Polyangiaceae bacterium]|nr:adenylate/guanylate cyclase domain-containing protein [Polyangiaceae bacterium]